MPMLNKISYFLAITFVVSFWGFVTPMFEFPDEQVHLETVTYVADHGQVPGDFTSDVTQEMYKTQEYLGTLRNDLGQNLYTYHPEYRIEYTDTLNGKYEEEIKNLNTKVNRTTYLKLEGARYPIAYYLYSSFWLKMVDQADLITRSFVVRLGSLPLTLLAAIYAYKTGLLLFCKPKIAITLASIIFLQPMYSFVGASVNSDIFHNLLFFALVYYCLAMIKRGISWQSFIPLLVIVFLDIYTKTQGYLTIPLIFMAMLTTLVKYRQWKILATLFAIFIVFLVFTTDKWLGFIISTNNSGITPLSFFNFSSNKLVAQNIVWFWGVFKWLGVVLPPIYWQIANRVVLLGILGFAIYIWKVLKKT